MSEVRLTARPVRSNRGSSEPLIRILSTLVTLQVMSKNYHWNVTGPSFPSLHKMFDKMNSNVYKWSDSLGERMRSLNLIVDAKMETYLRESLVDEGDPNGDSDSMKEGTIRSLSVLSAYLMGVIERDELDIITSNLLQEICAGVDQELYFFNSTI